MSVLQPPEAVRGMQKLQKDAFNKIIDFPVIEVDSTDVSVISRRVRLENYLIGQKFKPLKNFMEIDSDKSDQDDKGCDKKSMVFHPEKVDSEETKQKILEMLARELGSEKVLNWTRIQKELTFENWDQKAIFKAILPENIEYSSFTQTGHIIHCNFADETLPFRFIIAEVFLEKVKNCRTVVQKGNIITNVFRNLDLELLAGEPNYITEVKETGLRFKMDFSKVYWNSRLSHEHERITKYFNNQSIVYDACCGIGPFVLPAIVKKKPKRVMANDLNPDSVKWLRENLKLNKIAETRLEIFNLDANVFIKEKIAQDFMELIKKDSEGSTDSEESKNCEFSEIHVMMNLPAYAVNFLPAFRGVLRRFQAEIEEIWRKNGRKWKWNVYCYLFAKSHVDVPDDFYEKEARKMCDEKTKWDTSLVVKCHNVRTVSSRKEMFCAQLELPYEFLFAEPLPEESEVVELEPEEVDEPSSKRVRTDL